MNFRELKNSLIKEFEIEGIDEFSDIDWIVCEVTKKRRSELAIIENFSALELLQIQNLISLRLEHIPLAYIFGKTNFYGFELKVTKDILIPRIDTEVLVENVVADIKSLQFKPRVLDLCTGSGAIAIAIKKETNADVVASDISEKALKIAKQNADSNNADVEFIHSDLFENLSGEKFDIIVSNPPYIESGEILNLDKEVKDNEPILALDGGDDGLNYYKKIIEEAPKFLNKNGKLYFEIGYNQADAVSNLMKKSFVNIKTLKDYGNNDRIVVGEFLW